MRIKDLFTKISKKGWLSAEDVEACNHMARHVVASQGGKGNHAEPSFSGDTASVLLEIGGELSHLGDGWEYANEISKELFGIEKAYELEHQQLEQILGILKSVRARLKESFWENKEEIKNGYKRTGIKIERGYSEPEFQEAVRQAQFDAAVSVRAAYQFEERKAEAAHRRARISGFCERGVKAGTIRPAWVDAGIIEFMAHLNGDSDAIQFSEGTEKMTRLEWFNRFLESVNKLLPKK